MNGLFASHGKHQGQHLPEEQPKEEHVEISLAEAAWAEKHPDMYLL